LYRVVSRKGRKKKRLLHERVVFLPSSSGKEKKKKREGEKDECRQPPREKGKGREEREGDLFRSSTVVSRAPYFQGEKEGKKSGHFHSLLLLQKRKGKGGRKEGGGCRPFYLASNALLFFTISA